MGCNVQKSKCSKGPEQNNHDEALENIDFKMNEPQLKLDRASYHLDQNNKILCLRQKRLLEVREVLLSNQNYSAKSSRKLSSQTLSERNQS